MKITVLTPTYNRAYTLKKLYNSLLEQEENNFEWLIIDDGSSDNTKDIVDGFIKEEKMNISYYYQKNGGKHRALNTGIELINSELTFIVDSDDYLTKDAIKKINFYYNKYINKKGICGFSFLRMYDNSEVIGDKYNYNEKIDNYLKCRINENISGDKAEVFYTKILKEYKFPEFKNEKFLSEDVVWIEIGKKYNMVYINHPIYYTEYLNDGLSKNDKKMKFQSPIGSALRGKKLMYKKIKFKVNLKGAIIYDCYKMEIKENMPKELLLENNFEKLLAFLVKPLGYIYNRKWKRNL